MTPWQRAERACWLLVGLAMTLGCFAGALALLAWLWRLVHG